MIGYQDMEQAVIAQLLRVFAEEVDETRCKGGDLDSVTRGIFETTGARYGIVLDFVGATPMDGAPFNADTYIYTIEGVLMIRYTDEIETDLRKMITKMMAAFKTNPRLDGLTPHVKVTSIQRPEPISINDVPFYWIPFTIAMLDR